MTGIFESLNNLISSIINAILSFFRSIFAVFETIISSVVDLVTGIVHFLLREFLLPIVSCDSARGTLDERRLMRQREHREHCGDRRCDRLARGLQRLQAETWADRDWKEEDLRQWHAVAEFAEEATTRRVSMAGMLWNARGGKVTLIGHATGRAMTDSFLRMGVLVEH
jgi:hypothetical protein